MLSIGAVVYEEDEQSVEESALIGRDTLEQGKVDQRVRGKTVRAYVIQREIVICSKQKYNDKDESL